MRGSISAIAAATSLAALSTGAAAQDLVSAADPAQLASKMTQAGYQTELKQEATGEPEITTRFFGWPGSIRFYDCNSETHGDCRSLQLQVGFDRAKPMAPELVNYLMANVRYVGIFLDDQGDPWISWDILTGEGIPADVFLEALDTFSAQVDLVANTVFEQERGAE